MESAQSACGSSCGVVTHFTEPARDTKEVEMRRVDAQSGAALNEEQKSLVEQNTGLVLVHLKHYVTPHRIPWTQREWEDLVQEGNLGLMRAARDFDPQRNIPFAAFALPRIHTAVRRFMMTRFGRGVAFGGGPSRANASLFTNCKDLDWLPRKRLPTGRETDFEALERNECKETVGNALREKFERAVARAVVFLQEEFPPGPVRDLVRVVAQRRLLVPDDHEKAPFRRIAREAGATYGRVVDLNRRLRQAVRSGLENDPEFVELERLARADGRGVERPLDDETAASLARLGSAELIQRLINAGADRRGHLMGKLFHLAADSLCHVLRAQIERLPPSSREELINVSYPAENAAPEPEPIQRSASS